MSSFFLRCDPNHKKLFLFFKAFFFFLFIGLSGQLLSSCGIVRMMAGADIDSLQFAKAREAKMYEIRKLTAEKLYNRINSNEPLENADVVIYIGESLINKIAGQYKDITGWLDEKTSFIVQDARIVLTNGSAIASIGMKAHNNSYDVDVDMTMDCICVIEIVQNELSIKLEPFNISPNVTAGGLLGSSEEMISNLIKINLANIDKNFPPLKIPVDFSNQLLFPYINMQIKDKINMKVISPQRTIDYNFKLKEVLIFDRKALVTMNISKVEVK